MKDRLLKIARYAAYPAFYLFCLGLFGYLTFPYDRLKDRLIAEFERAQTKRGGAATQRLEIDELDSYWFTGVEVKGARLILPPDESAKRSAPNSSLLGAGASGAKDKPEGPKPTVIEIDEAHARVRLLPLLIGRVRVDFWARVFGGEVEGVAPVGKSGGTVHVEVSNVDLSKVEPLAEMLGGIPLSGTVNAKMELEAPEGKFNKANGTLELTAVDMSVLDGKTKIQGLLELPTAKLGDLTLSAEAKDGILKVTKLSAPGPDVELEGDGKINIREPWNNSVADLYVRFKIADPYRGKTDATKSAFGEPGATTPGMVETFVPKMKRAKRSDGFFGWHVHGALKKVKFDPHASDAPASRSRTKGSDSPFGGSKKPGGLNLPLGASDASPSRSKPEPVEEKAADKEPERAPPSPPPPPPPPPPEEQRMVPPPSAPTPLSAPTPPPEPPPTSELPPSRRPPDNPDLHGEDVPAPEQ